MNMKERCAKLVAFNRYVEGGVYKGVVVHKHVEMKYGLRTNKAIVSVKLITDHSVPFIPFEDEKDWLMDIPIYANKDVSVNDIVYVRIEHKNTSTITMDGCIEMIEKGMRITKPEYYVIGKIIDCAYEKRKGQDNVLGHAELEDGYKTIVPISERNKTSIEKYVGKRRLLWKCYPNGVPSYRICDNVNDF